MIEPRYVNSFVKINEANSGAICIAKEVGARRIGLKVVHARWRKIHCFSLRQHCVVTNVHYQTESTQVVKEVQYDAPNSKFLRGS